MLSVSYKSSRAVKASLSVLITCSAVFKAPLADDASNESISDIALEDSDEIGVMGRWKIEVESIAVAHSPWKGNIF